MFGLLFPMGMIKDLIFERQGNREIAEREIGQKWGGIQQVTGPILTIPYRKFSTDEKGKVDSTIEYAHFLPEILDVKGSLIPEIRHRGIFDIALFKSDLEFNGKFIQPDFFGWRIAPQDIIWSDAFLSISIPDVRSLSEDLPLLWRDAKNNFTPENYVGSPFSGGLHALVKLNGNEFGSEGYTFSFHANLNGKGTMNFLPMGKETKVSLSSTWGTPSFAGAFLPIENSVKPNGFQARWKTLHLSRSFPQSWRNFEVTVSDWNNFAFGVDLKIPVDQYQETTRCAKYAILFISLTFLIFFIFELFEKIRIHPLQYLLVGFALCLFYLLLLALTEHIPFDFAYYSASLATVALITLYSLTIFSNKKQSLGLGGMLTGLYAYLFVLLQMEDFALLMGALGLFIILATVMYVTRKINFNSSDQ